MTQASQKFGGGSFHTCAIQTDQTVFCFGKNSLGALGDNTKINRAFPVQMLGIFSATSISLGGDFTCVVDNGQAKCVGHNANGQLGDGTAAQRLLPVIVSGLNRNVVDVTCGIGHACALLNGGGMSCWGKNKERQLAAGSNVIKSMVPLGVKNFATSGVSKMAGGEWHTCLITALGGVMCAGLNDFGQIGDGSNKNSVPLMTPVLGLGDSTVLSISCGARHTCAILSGSNGVQCWGKADSGQLGHSSFVKSNIPVTPVGLDTGVSSVSCGWESTCVVKTEGTVYCFGGNSFGQFGIGNTQNWNFPQLSFVNTPVLLRSHGISSSLPVEAVVLGNDFACMQQQHLFCVGRDTYGMLGNGEPLEDSLVVVPVISLTPPPSFSPSATSQFPTKEPTSQSPSLPPTLVPTKEPTVDPTTRPTKEPSWEPTLLPTFDPTYKPSKEPTLEPTYKPSKEPTLEPTGLPIQEPTRLPTSRLPSNIPTVAPTVVVTDFTPSPSSVPPTSVAPTQRPESNTSIILPPPVLADNSTLVPPPSPLEQELSQGQVAGIVIGVLLIVLAGFLLVFVLHGWKGFDWRFGWKTCSACWGYGSSAKATTTTTSLPPDAKKSVITDLENDDDDVPFAVAAPSSKPPQPPPPPPLPPVVAVSRKRTEIDAQLQQELILKRSTTERLFKDIPLEELFFPEGKDLHLFMSHAWGKTNHEHVRKFTFELEKLGLQFWFDSERLSGDIEAQISRGLKRSVFFVCCVTEDYICKVEEDKDVVDWCQYEWSAALRGHWKKTLVVATEPQCTNPRNWMDGRVRHHLGGMLVIDASREDLFEQAALQVLNLVKQGMLRKSPAESSFGSTPGGGGSNKSRPPPENNTLAMV